MQWAEGGSLDDFIDVRLGRPSPNYLAHFHTPGGSYASKSPEENSTTTNDTNSPSLHSRSARIRAFRAMQRAPPAERERMKKELEMSIAAGQNGARSGKTNWTAVHLLSAEEVKGLFSDVVSGLAFLVKHLTRVCKVVESNHLKSTTKLSCTWTSNRETYFSLGTKEN